MKVYKAPTPAPPSSDEISVFLAGSIEMGAAENWQEIVTTELVGFTDRIYNPRREDWDSSWKQEASDPKFREQVLWELDHLVDASFIFLYLSPGTKSPISLLELGLHAGLENLIVCCPDGFWRKGNVEITCEYYSVPFFDNLNDAIKHLKLKIYESFK